MLLMLTIFFDFLKMSNAVNGIIWNKQNQNFVPLFSISSFRTAQNDHVKAIYNIEFHNFHGQNITLTYYEEDQIVNFHENDTKITGMCGEIWHILGDYLNFTLVPIRSKDRNFGTQLRNGSFNGLLGILEKNQSVIIPRSGLFASRLSLLDYTLPLWKVRYHLYIIPEWKHDEMWMIHLFSAKLWYAIFFMICILSVAGFICEKYAKGPSEEKKSHKLQDFILYGIGLTSSQGSVPMELYKKSRLIYICTSIFCWLILIAFNSHAIFLMMNKKFTLPFTDLRELFQKSKYGVVAFSGSMVHEAFQEKIATYYRTVDVSNRVYYVNSTNKVYEEVCFSKNKKLAAFEAEDRHQALGNQICSLVSTQTFYFQTWIASAVRRGYRYKRSFDIGILKMYEVGLLDGIKDRWLALKIVDVPNVPFQSIDMSQVYAIFGILCFGFIASMIILLFENIILLKNKIFKYTRKEVKKQVIKVDLKKLY